MSFIRPTLSVLALGLAMSAFGSVAVADDTVALPPALQGANVKLGEKEFNKCKACHTAGKGQPNRIGPNLYGIFGRKAGTVAGFRYSPDMKKNADWTWDVENIDHWIANPRAVLKRTTMAFAGIKDEAHRKDLLAYLYQETGGENAE